MAAPLKPQDEPAYKANASPITNGESSVSFIECVLQASRNALGQPDATLKYALAGKGPMLDPSIHHNILIYEATSNPPHQGHKQTLVDAKTKSGWNISAAFVIVKSEAWTKEKLQLRLQGTPSQKQEIYFPIEDRVALWEDSEPGSDWYCVVAYTANIEQELLNELERRGIRFSWIELVGAQYIRVAAKDDKGIVTTRAADNVLMDCTNSRNAPFEKQDGTLTEIELANGQWTEEIEARITDTDGNVLTKVWSCGIGKRGEIRYIQNKSQPFDGPISSTMIRDMFLKYGPEIAGMPPVQDMVLHAGRIASGAVKYAIIEAKEGSKDDHQENQKKGKNESQDQREACRPS